MLESRAERMDAFRRVKAELITLLRGKRYLTPAEVYQIRQHAKSKTRLDVNPEELSAEEYAWYAIYSETEKWFSEILDPEKKALMDKLEHEIDMLDKLMKFQKWYITEGWKLDKWKQLTLSGFVVGFLCAILISHQVLLSVTVGIGSALIVFLTLGFTGKSRWAGFHLAIIMWKIGRALSGDNVDRS